MQAKEGKYKTRLAWLSSAARYLRAYLRRRNLGFRRALHLSAELEYFDPFVLGWCYPLRRRVYICIAPHVGDSIQALEVLLHELIHACLPDEVDHGPEFQTACAKAGLAEGIPETAFAGPKTRRYLQRLVSRHLGDYPPRLS